MGRRATMVIGSGVVFLVTSCQNDRLSVGLPPMSEESRSFLFGIAGHYDSFLSAHERDAPGGFSFESAHHTGKDLRLSFLVYDQSLAELSLPSGRLEPAPASTTLTREIPTPDEVWSSQFEGNALTEWIRTEPASHPYLSTKLSCPSSHHDGGDGRCVPLGTCSPGFLLSNGECVERCLFYDPGGACTDTCPAGFACELFYPGPRVSNIGFAAHRARLGDLNGDGKRELVVTGWSDVAIFETGFVTPREIARYHLGDAVQAAYGIGIGDTDNDGGIELWVGSWQDDLFELRLDGATLRLDRRIPRRGYGHWAIDILDVDGVAGNEVILSDRYGKFHALRFNGTSYETYFTSPMIGTMSMGEDFKTIVIGSADSNGNGVQEVVTYGTGGDLDVWEAAGDRFDNILHVDFDTSGNDTRNAWRGAILDVDRDGADEIFYGTEGGDLVLLDHTGGAYVETWRTSVGFYPLSMDAGDVDLDGTPDVLVGGLEGQLWVIDVVTGQKTSLPNTGPEASVQIDDFDEDGHPDIIVVQGGSVRTHHSM